MAGGDIFTTNFPAALDTLNELPLQTDPSKLDPTQINVVTAILRALEAEVGKTPNPDAGSIRYALENLGVSEHELLVGAAAVYDHATKKNSYGIADHFDDASVDPAWTQSPSSNGSITEENDYIELTDTGDDPESTQLIRPILAHMPFEIACHVEKVSTTNNQQGGIVVADADDKAVYVLHWTDNHPNVFIVQGGQNYGTGTVILGGAGEAFWIRLVYDGYSIQAFSNLGAESVEPTTWFFQDRKTPGVANPRHIQVPATVQLQVAQWGNNPGVAATYRFRHFRLRYL